MENVIKVGTRNSELAMAQTRQIVALLQHKLPLYNIEVISMTTTGDQILDSPLHQIGSKALFTKELEVALTDKTVDIVVHSMKDMPTSLPDGLCIGAVTCRVDPHDVLVMSMRNVEKGRKTIEDLPAGSILGTSSVRRIAQLRKNYPDLKFQDIRGNLNTRMRKLDDADGKYDALVLAYAGMHRLGWDNRISQFLSISAVECITGKNSDDSTEIPTSKHMCYYAVGQGAIAIECRMDDDHILNILSMITDLETEIVTAAERSLMKALEGGCSVPLGVSCCWVGSGVSDEGGKTHMKTLSLSGIVCSVDGKNVVEAREEIKSVQTIEQAVQLGQRLAQNMIGKGAKEILDEIKSRK